MSKSEIGRQAMIDWLKKEADSRSYVPAKKMLYAILEFVADRDRLKQDNAELANGLRGLIFLAGHHFKTRAELEQIKFCCDLLAQHTGKKG